jgi:predicted MFS family arabinose efflux permease
MSETLLEKPMDVTAEHAPTAAVGAPTLPPLRRNRRFQALWGGAAAAQLGVNVADMAYPLLVLATTGSALAASAFGAVQTLCMMVCGLPAGALLDRHDRRRILIGAELARLAAMAGLVLCVVTHVLDLPLLLAIGAVVGGTTAISGPARKLATRAVVPAEQLTSALVQEEARGNIAQLLGLPLGSVLYTLGRALPFVTAAVGSLVSALTVFAVRFDAHPTAPADDADSADGANRPADEGMLAGFRVLFGDALLRSTLLLCMLVNLVGVPLDLVIVVLARQQHVPTGAVGLIAASVGAGALIGSVLVKRVFQLLRPGWTMIAVTSVIALMVAGLAAPFGGFWMAGCALLAGMVMPCVMLLIDVLIFRQVDDTRRGRVMGATSTLIYAGMPVGMLVGGALLSTIGATRTALLMGAAIGLAVLAAASSRAVRRAEWPADAS